MKLMTVKVTSIGPGKNSRRIDKEHVRSLAAELESGPGLLQPIVVRAWPYKDDKGYEWQVVAGSHRLEAVKRAKQTEVGIRIVEVSDYGALALNAFENLQRKDYTPVERVCVLGEMEEAYLKDHPETKQGVAGGLARAGKASEVLSFAVATSKSLRMSMESIRRYTRVYKILGPETVKALHGTSLDDFLKLRELVHRDADTRRRLIKRAVAGDKIEVDEIVFKRASPAVDVGARESDPTTSMATPEPDGADASVAPDGQDGQVSSLEADPVLGAGSDAGSASSFEEQVRTDPEVAPEGAEAVANEHIADAPDGNPPMEADPLVGADDHAGSASSSEKPGQTDFKAAPERVGAVASESVADASGGNPSVPRLSRSMGPDPLTFPIVPTAEAPDTLAAFKAAARDRFTQLSATYDEPIVEFAREAFVDMDVQELGSELARAYLDHLTGCVDLDETNRLLDEMIAADHPEAASAK